MGTLSLTDAVNNTTADASLVNTNNAAIKAVVNGGIDNTNVNASAGIVGSKLGITYAAYTPTWTASGTAPAIGNATVVARYAQWGKVVHAYGQITFGSTSTYGTGNFTFALPATAASTVGSTNTPIGSAYVFDTSASKFSMGIVVPQSTTLMNIQYPATFDYDIQSVMGQLVPFTWATGDQFCWTITYEAA